MKGRLKEHLQEIVRDRHPYFSSGGHFYVQQYLCDLFQQWGKLETHEFDFSGHKHTNYILNIAPANPTSKSPILLAAHYDGVPGTPGADDNATVVAVLLALMQEFAQNPPSVPLRLVAFDLEEHGMLGSKAYVKALKTKKEKIRLMFSLEMLGYCSHEPNSQEYPSGLENFYPNAGNYIAFISNLRTMPDARFFSRQMQDSGTRSEWLSVPFSGRPLSATRLSDHSPFWDQGYRAMMVTDTSFLRNPHYHQPSDTLETLDLDFLTGVCEGLIAGLRNWK